MPLFYKRTSIDLGNIPQQHGHVVYPDARYRSEHADPRPVVYKENKYSSSELSRFEVAFSELARLFLAPDLTPSQVLVKSEQQAVVGTACEHISYTIARCEILPALFYQIDKQESWQLYCQDVTEPKDVPFYFFDKFAPGFFNVLRCAEKKGEISFDMGSLARVLAGSYTLEEDDLHKGNFGFYIVQKDNKPHVVFFKIDHDLMLADSVMSHCHTRFFNWFHGAGAFEITARDLLNFPFLTDSQNYYWPTVKRTIFGIGNKAYSTDDEVDAFADLARSPEFCRSKWMEFYKHILVPPWLIEQALSKHFDNSDPHERAHIALITQSVVVRLAKLRAVLFSIPAFREVVSSLSFSEQYAMVHGIAGNAEPACVESLETDIAMSMLRYKELCQHDSFFVQGDTPLHAAIKLQDYRYDDTWQAFGHYVEQKNAQGQTPLDVAMGMARLSAGELIEDIRCDSLCTMKHLLKEGARKTADYQPFEQSIPTKLNDYLFHSDYPKRAQEQDTMPQLIQLLHELGEDYRISLKMKKELAVICVRKFVAKHQHHQQLANMLSELKVALNGAGIEPPAPELQFIRQLRSQLWIVRIVRGLLGGTATQVQLNALIDKEIKNLTPSTPGRWLFFSRKKQPFQGDEELTDYSINQP